MYGSELDCILTNLIFFTKLSVHYQFILTRACVREKIHSYVFSRHIFIIMKFTELQNLFKQLNNVLDIKKVLVDFQWQIER